MKKILIGSLTLSVLLTAGSMAQTSSQRTTTGNTTKAANPKNQTSSTEGMKRTGSGETNRGNGKMEGHTVSRSGNTLYSPTAPTSAQGSEYVIVAPSDEATARSGSADVNPESEARWVNQLPALGPRVRTQGSSSEGSASVPTPGGAPGTNTKIVVRTQPNRSTSTLSTSGESGSRQPSSAEGVREESNAADELNGANQATTGASSNSRQPVQNTKTSESGLGGASTSRVNIKEEGKKPGSSTDLNKKDQRPGTATSNAQQTSTRSGSGTGGNRPVSNSGQGTAKGSSGSKTSQSPAKSTSGGSQR